MHTDFLSEIALVALVALVCGVLLERLRQPAVLGYILAGIILGPSMLAWVENREDVNNLAELGILMLLFIIGMELNLQDFKKTWHVSLLCIILQVIGSLAAVWVVTYFFDLSLALSVLLAFAIALSSTAVAVKMLESIGELKTQTGRLTIGVLIAQDLAIVPMILILRSINTASFDMSVITKIILSMAILVLVIFILGRRENITLPFAHIVERQPDLVPLVNISLCLGLATLTGLLGLSAAYGAFLAGLILGNTSGHQKLMKAAKPLQSLLMMVFFLSIGLLMDLGYIWQNLVKVSYLLLIITVGKSLMNIGILHLLGQPWHRSFIAGLLLAQMGEFAFLLTSVGESAGILNQEDQSLIISLAALSLAFSPLWFAGARRLHNIRTKEDETFNELLDTAYGQELQVLSKCTNKITKTCKAIIKRIKGNGNDTQRKT